MDEILAVDTLVLLDVTDDVVVWVVVVIDFDINSVETSTVSCLRFLSCSLGASTTRLPTLNPGIANIPVSFPADESGGSSWVSWLEVRVGGVKKS